MQSFLKSSSPPYSGNWDPKNILPTERYGEDNERHAKGKLFALCPLESISGSENAVRTNALVDLLHGKSPFKATVELNEAQEVEWLIDLFSVNRFFLMTTCPSRFRNDSFL